MPKAKNPSTFADYFKISPAKLDKLDVLNPTLAIDTKLFIDPLLLGQSRQPEIRDAATTYRAHFERIIKLLRVSSAPWDLPWRNAIRLFQFHEVPGTCIGYGTATIRGSGFGEQLTEQVVATAREIVRLGIDDPDLFQALALFEEGIGPDRISDMTTNVISSPC